MPVVVWSCIGANKRHVREIWGPQVFTFFVVEKWFYIVKVEDLHFIAEKLQCAVLFFKRPDSVLFYTRLDELNIAIQTATYIIGKWIAKDDF